MASQHGHVHSLRCGVCWHLVHDSQRNDVCARCET